MRGIKYVTQIAGAMHHMTLIADAGTDNVRLHQVLLHHRTGFVRGGEASLFLRVSAQHRANAFEASQWIVDELKQKVPIWKRPRFNNETQRGATQRAAATV